ncbi:MAG: lacC [Planctomycetaceae bacterium]|nr:lacC [Planctomycetaceae bacterium]
MILAAGLTPAWQQILVFDQLFLGEVNRATEVHCCASGKVLNVGVALHHLGASSRTLAAGGGWSLAAMQADLQQLGVPCRWITTSVPTRVCTTVLDSGGQMTTELVENSGVFSADELAQYQHAYLEEAAAAEVVVLSGSLPINAPETYYRDLVARTPGRVVLDVRGIELLHALHSKPFLVKPNRAELAKTLNRNLHQDADLQAAMLDLNASGARWVVITDGPHAVWVSSASQVWKLQPPQIDVVNPIGSGDSLAAGVAAALDAGVEVLEAVRHGIASAAYNATQLLPCRLDPQRIRDLQTQVTVSVAK